jgi:cytoskeletal protein CcmA (bactofilin family)
VGGPKDLLRVLSSARSEPAADAAASDTDKGVYVEERRKSCWISGAITVKGNVTSAGDLVIDGRVEGAIEIGDHNLTIGDSASVVADLMAKDVIIAGNVKGNVLGAGKVELKKSSTVEGDITAPRFLMEEGATLIGRVDTGERK